MNESLQRLDAFMEWIMGVSTMIGGKYQLLQLATKFDLDKAQSVRPKGHCVAVMVTSEDPDDGFKPTSGRMEVGLHDYTILFW